MADQDDSIQRVYMMSDGTGRTRGTRDGQLRDTLRWRTIMLSTGEKPLIGEDSPTGTKARVLNLPVDGFGGLGANEVDDLRGLTERHYGHAGRAWVHRLVQNTDWTPWRARLFDLVKELRTSVRAGGPRARQAGYWALFVVTEMLAARLLDLGDREGGTMRHLFGSLAESATPSAAERALELLSAHRLRHPEAWVEVQTHENGYMEPKDWDRKRNIVGYHTESRVFLIPDAARELFQKHALDWSVVAKHWRDMELVELDEHGYNPRVRIAGRRTRMVVLAESFLSGDGDGKPQQELFQDSTVADEPGFVEF